MNKAIRLILVIVTALNLPVHAHGPSPADTVPSDDIPPYILNLLAAARARDGQDKKSLESELEEEHLRRVREMEQQFLETAVDPAKVDEEKTPPKQELDKMPVETFLTTEPEYLAGLFTRIMTFGRGKQLKEMILKAMHRVSVAGDAQNYTVKVSGSPIPNAMIYPEEAIMIINLGLLGLAANEDEVAHVIAHEMTHQNKEFFKAAQDNPEFDKVLDQVQGYAGLDQAQREEIRADLGATERVIKAGYNPWGGYDFEKRLAGIMATSWDVKIMNALFNWIYRRSFHYMEAHPASEIRMAAIKAYILKRSREIDLADHTAKYTKFRGALRTLHLQMQAITKPLMSRWGQRGQQAFISYNIYSLLMADTWIGRTASDVTAPVAHAAAKALSTAAETAGGAVGAVLSPLWTALSTVGSMISFIVSLPGYLVPDVVKENSTDIMGVITGGGLMAASIGMLSALALSVLRAFVRDEAFPAYAQVMEANRELKQLKRSGAIGPKEYLEYFKILNKIGNALQTIYFTASLVRFSKSINGVSYMYLKSYWLYLTTLSALVKEAQALDGAARAKFVADAVEQAEELPGYVFAFKRIRREYMNLIRLSSRSVRPLASAQEFLEFDKSETDLIRRRMILHMTADSFDSRTPADLRVHVAFEFAKTGAVDMALDLIGQFPVRIIDEVLSEKTADPEVTRRLQALLIRAREGTAFRPSGYWMQILKDLFLLEEKLRSRITGRREALLSLTKQIPARGLFFKYLQPRRRLEAADANALKREMVETFQSSKEVLANLDAEVTAKGGLMETIAPIFINALILRPDWVQSRADVDAILERRDIWPQFNGAITASSPLEFAFVIAIRKLRDRFPSVWSFEPAWSEKMHKVLVARLKELGQYPQTTAELSALWKKMTDRGVTSTTDAMFHEIYHKANDAERQQLDQLALSEGRVWETEIKAEIAFRRIFSSNDFNMIMATTNAVQRRPVLESIIKDIQTMIPEGGRVYWDILEELSVRIESSEEESATIHKAKSMDAGGEKQEDFGLRVLSELTNEALSWSRKHQWALIQFLRKRGPVTAKIQAAFNTVGPERVQRMYDLLPLLARTQLLDAFLDAPRGLLGKFKSETGWGKTIFNEIFDGKESEEVRIAKEVLDAFLYALKKTGNGASRSYVVSYLLAQQGGNQTDTSLILKNVLEIFGATGVKIGQFLAASGILPEKVTAVLRTLQERANMPLREEIYHDVREALGQKSVPFKVGSLKGAASIKYAIEIYDNETQHKAILKMFRLAAVAHTRMEFFLLERMADRLVKKHGTKYGVFRSIVRASRAAVERELEVPEEVKKSLAARRYVYVNLDEAGIKVTAPFEVLVGDRAILAEYADGGSFFSLRDDLKPLVAKKILQMERDNLFADKPIILFDPDRHAGNYRISINEFDGKKYLVIDNVDISAIDMGQLLELSPAIREKVIDLFALSQILREVGPNHDLAERMIERYGMDVKKAKAFRQALAQYFPDKDGKEITAYFGLLAALEAGGVKIDIVYFDFVRAVIQLQQYEPFVEQNRTWMTPSEKFKAEVKTRVDAIVPTLKLDTTEKLKYAWNSSEGGLWTRATSVVKMWLDSRSAKPAKAMPEKPVAANRCEEALLKRTGS